MDDLIVSDIECKIYTIRGIQVMLDRDLATLYNVPTKRLNEQVKRNIERFPNRYRFQLSEKEKYKLVAFCDQLENLKFSSNLPYVFTEQGVSMLASVLKSQTAISVSIKIIDAFVTMRKFLSQNASVFSRLDRVELKQFEHDNKFEEVFRALETHEKKQGIFFDGQIFDAHNFLSDIIRSANNSIILIDNYIDDSVLTLFSKRKNNIKVTIYTREISKQIQLDLKKYNLQYPPIEIKEFTLSHDRFIIIDNKKLYHFGASLKDLGKKWFAFSRFDKETFMLLNKLEL